MRGCRELLLDFPDSLPISSAIAVIERSIPGEAGLAFTHSRGLLETVCKTILADHGTETEADANPNRLMSQTLKVLKLTRDDFDKDPKVESGVADIIRGINQLTNGVVALRNSQGLGPHGKDALEAVLDSDYAEIAAQAVDYAATLLYRLHKKNAEDTPLKRLRFSDFAEFNDFLDDKYSCLIVEEVPIQASVALHGQDLEAYRQALMGFMADPPGNGGDDGFAEGEEVGADG